MKEKAKRQSSLCSRKLSKVCSLGQAAACSFRNSLCIISLNFSNEDSYKWNERTEEEGGKASGRGGWE